MWLELLLFLFGPRQANLVLIANASSEGSGEPARMRSLAEPPLLAHTSSESRGTFRQKARSLAPLNGWTCAVKICHDGMLEDTNSLDAAHLLVHSLVLRLLSNLQNGLFPAYPYMCLAFHKWDLRKQRRPRSDASEHSVWSESTVFAYWNFYYE